ncbi:ethanolamine ammonia-lyase subunit EutC [Achromobacter sp. GG226]|uniref:ethanolamine ammonia-lyase subunit EutC n=1 Tax=Verticiella alkaliphila TaxID=2779529 RepID=UPI001C0C2A79|nr:ethanolamine ammonia-lyase subunit EutC [Verticiella sp. GG226]MBU4610747.1 ethanolamine ammonia-lyase subunit EutC [Verticiella sp. GG226]
MTTEPTVPADASPEASDPTHSPPDLWRRLQAFTPARIGLGRAGASLPTAEVLRFGLAHARARDAVHHPLDPDALAAVLAADGFRCLTARSQAPDRPTYLRRPDLGRALDADDATRLKHEAPAPEIAVVVADGLSAVAVERHAPSLLCALRDTSPADWERTPIVIVEQGRVAVGDPIGEALRARLVIVLIGERPGLSSPDSLGIYVTFDPRPGRRDSERNCISNVRPEGLTPAEAARKLSYLVQQALRLGYSGVRLKDDSEAALTPSQAPDVLD